MKIVRLINILFIVLCIETGSPAFALTPERIVSCSPSFTEILFALGKGEQVVGVTDFCRFPPEALKKQKIGGFLNPNLEKVIYLKPDLVVVQDAKSQMGEKMKRLGLPVLEIRNESLSDSLKAVEIIAGAAGVPERGKALKRNLEEKLNSIRKKYENTDKVRTLIVVDRSPEGLKDIYVSAPGTYLNEILEIAGGVNVLSRQPALYPKISKESLIALNPDVILDTTLAGQNFTSKTLQSAVDSWQDIPLLRAVKNQRIFMLTDPAVTIQGPRIAETTGHMADILHKNNGEVKSFGQLP
ncbi:ABC transporter substrate-binding protein [Candidatus Sumerlaeota bacterium]|nr:ABC transporter substrate-binding protein [Candidatus Sumerlaeota bacterium]